MPDDGNLSFIFEGRYNDHCWNGLLLPIFPYESSWNTGLRAFLYFGGLMYCFMGIAIVADVFMGAIEKITSTTRKIHLSTGKSSEPEVVEVRVWNDTVANLTLMALGSSAPEILLSCIEIVGNNFEAGDLGPGTIVGSAAFNLLVITGVCMIAIPKGESRAIRSIKVFLVTTVFSLFAYIWLLLILDYISPNVIDLWEAILTFLLFPLLVLIAWWADRDWKFGKLPLRPQVADQLDQQQVGMTNDSPESPEAGPGGEPDSSASMQAKCKLIYKDGELDKEAFIQFYQELRKFPDISDTDAATLAATKLVDTQPHSRLWYRIGACRGLAGSKKVLPVLSDKLREVYDIINARTDVPHLDPLREEVTEPRHGEAIVEFNMASFAVPENIGSFNVTVVRYGRMDNTVRVKVESVDGTAKSASDYIKINKQIVFGPYEKEYEVTVEIIDDIEWEPDEEFFLRLSLVDGNIDSKGVIIGPLHIMEIVILDDDVLQRVFVLTTNNLKSLEVHHETYKAQLQSALTVNGGDIETATGFDYFMHFMTFGWKILFALIPPPGLLGGWLCFVSSLLVIGLLTTIVGDLASIFGCLVGLKDTVTAITFVALGTSLPDLFASKTAAAQEKYADNAIGNVTGSNSVNVFLGLGLPWVLAAAFHYTKGGIFVVKSGSLGFSVLIYSSVAFVALGLILVRRYVAFFGKAELGGPGIAKWGSGIFLFVLWLFYITLSSLKAYGYNIIKF